jgi:hypothetical protein
VPFFALIIVVVVNGVRAFLRVRKTADASSVCVPVAAVLAAGLVHAGFEDWLFAVGYYLCVFFWPMAFILVDVLRPFALSLKTTRDRVSPAYHAASGLSAASR